MRLTMKESICYREMTETGSKLQESVVGNLGFI